MKTFIYIKNDAIQLVYQQKDGCKTAEIPLEKGCILNGVIIDPNAIKTALASVNPLPKSVTLVVDSSNIMTKKMQVPAVSQKKLLEIVKGEFDLFQKDDQYLFDANVLQQGAMLTVMSYAVNKDFIDAYRAIFEKLSIKVTRIEVAINGIIKHVAQIPQLQNETFLLNILSGDNMLSLLFEQGQYKLTNRNRLLQTGQDGATAELYSKLSSMVQFSQSEKSAYSIQRSYYIGLSVDQLLALAQYTAGVSGVEIRPYIDPSMPDEFIYPYTAMVQNKRDVNFAKNRADSMAKEAKGRSIAGRGLIALVVIAIMAIHGASVSISAISANVEHNRLTNYLTSSDTTSQLETYETTMAQKTAINEALAQIEQVLAQVESENPLQAQVLQAMLDDGLISSLQYNFGSQTVSLTGVAGSDAEVVAYVTALRATGYFDTLSYSGYTVSGDFTTDDEGNLTSNTYYQFSMSGSFAVAESEADDE